MSTAFKADTNAATLLAAYKALPPDSKTIMWAKGLIGITQNKSNFVDSIARARVLLASGRSWTLRELNPILNTLTAEGLLEQDQSCAAALRHDCAIDAMRSSQRDALKAAALKAMFSDDFSKYYQSALAQGATPGRMRLAVYINDEALYQTECERAKRLLSLEPIAALAPFFKETPLAIDWLSTRHTRMQCDLIGARLQSWLANGTAAPDLAPLLAFAHAEAAEPDFAPLGKLIAAADLVRLDFPALRRTAAGRDNAADQLPGLLDEAALSFLGGALPQAIEAFRAALKLLRKQGGKRKLFLPPPHGNLFVLAMLGANDPALYPAIEADLLQWMQGNPREQYAADRHGIVALSLLLTLAQGQEGKVADLQKKLRVNKSRDPLSNACLCLLEYALDSDLAAKHRDETLQLFRQWRDTMPLLAHILADILLEIGDAPECADFLAAKRAGAPAKMVSFTRLISARKPWERALETLTELLAPPRAEAKPAALPSAKRLAWFINPDTLDIEVAEQVARGAGWSDGRPVALKRLRTHDAQLQYLTPQDRRATLGIRAASSGWGRDESYEFDPYRVLPALVGHPYLFDARKRSQPISLVAHPVELVIDPRANAYHISLSHTAETPKVLLEAETPTRFRVIEINTQIIKIQEIIGARGLTVPEQARERIVALVKQDSPTLPINAGVAALGAAAIDGDATPVLQLIPRGEQLMVRLAVRPFGAEGPSYVPGIGASSVLAVANGEQRRANRDLQQEIQRMAKLVEACPSLQQRLGEQSHETAIEGLEASLDLLLEVQAFTAAGGKLGIEWPEGGKLKVSTVTADQLTLKVRASRDWFAVTGRVAVAPDAVLEMRFLLERLANAHGRFVTLDDGSFLALTHKLQAQLKRLAAIAEPDKNGLRLSPFAADAVGELFNEAGKLDADAAWRQHVATLEGAEDWTPRVPAALQAELRDYQVEGFAWLARLARLRAGACLADDMGLGKTVQAIAVMLHRAEEGPCLVVAPTSVVPNWAAELARFAPSLTVRRLGAAADRAAMVGDLGPRAVLLSSYGLLHQEAELLGGIAWQMVVVDEAQAVKNADTKRAQALQHLQARFRLALTGTPVENDLDELWSLFNFITPGLLGTRERFQRRFAGPIERNRDATARQALKALIRPFLLRRTKALVLSELPPRTETTLMVEMGAEERAFYEALRQKALEDLAAQAEPDGRQRFKILAEIMRLRRACCGPALIDPNIGLPGAKLAAFLELVEDLRANRHQALVFSQFVGHLELVRKALDQRKIAYNYLDGSTPPAERERQVAAFQGGGADLFLISLRAGGTGLNLTAADYVIHLDPWWNPAVEDQASDRAHRIGQTRPVTIYRLIMEDSIEERILALHRDKRDLASELLDGAEISGRLSEQELLQLIRG